MPFYLYISDDEQGYFDGLPLSPEAKDRVREFVEQFVANVPDEFRLNPENRPRSDKPCFLIQHIILDREGDGLIHTIDFYIQDDKAASGVLVIAYIEHH